MSTHGLVSVAGTVHVIACCSCGWRSMSASSHAGAELRFRIHVVERRAADISDAAKSIQDRTIARRVALAEQRAATQARRRQIARQRIRVREAIERVRAANSVAVPSSLAPHSVIDRACEMAGLTIDELWVSYFGFGGNLDRPTFAAVIAGVEPLTSREYDIAACALNERFAAAGFGHPLDYWNELPSPSEPGHESSA